MSIVDTKANNAALVDFVIEDLEPTSLTSPSSNRAAPSSAPDRESWTNRVARFFAALGQNGTTGANAFMIQDRAVYQEFRVSAERQAMAS